MRAQLDSGRGGEVLTKGRPEQDLINHCGWRKAVFDGIRGFCFFEDLLRTFLFDLVSAIALRYSDAEELMSSEVGHVDEF